MSCMESKVVLRAELPELKGKSRNEVYPVFVNLIGEADDIDEYEGEIEYFQYEGEIQPVYDYDSKRWGIDHVLHHESDYRTYIKMKSNGLSLKEFDELASQMEEKFGIDKSKVRLISYSWYNGGDEPINFD